MDLVKKIQSQIEALYGIRIGEQAENYLIDKHELLEILPSHQQTVIPKELFLVNPNPQNETLEVALFLDSALKQNLTTNNPLQKLDQQNISDFCTLIEGVSHFVYYVHKACLDFEITELELELQAEIDKFLLLTMLVGTNGGNIQSIFELLFEDYRLVAKLSDAQKERYHTASSLARKYCYQLSKNLQLEHHQALFNDIRLFYPLTQEQKIRHIMQ